MRNESDLRTALDELAAEGEQIIAFRELLPARPTATRPRLGRVVAPALAALVVVAVAVVGFAVFGERNRTGNPSGARQAQPLTWRFAVQHVSGFVISRQGIYRYSAPAADVSEDADVAASGASKVSGDVEFDSVPGRVVRTAHASTVDGIRYFFRPGRYVTRQGGLTKAQYAHPWVAVSQDSHGPRLSWQLPDGSQFIINGSFGFRPRSYDYDNAIARHDLMAIASAVRTGRKDDATMPFRVSAPHGLTGVGVQIVGPSQQHSAGLGGRLPISACEKFAKPAHPSPSDPIESLLLVCRVKPITGRHQTLESIDFGGDLVARSFVRRLPDGTLLAVGVARGRANLFTQAQLKSIAEHADVSPNLSTSSTWLDVN